MYHSDLSCARVKRVTRGIFLSVGCVSAGGGGRWVRLILYLLIVDLLIVELQRVLCCQVDDVFLVGEGGIRLSLSLIL